MRKLLLIALLAAPGVEAAYKCTDKSGRTHIGDTPPAQCADVVMYETSASGMVLRKIDPTPTAEEVKAKVAAEEKKKLDDIAAGEQRRKDLALLATYTSEKDFDLAADRNLDPIHKDPARAGSATARSAPSSRCISPARPRWACRPRTRAP